MNQKKDTFDVLVIEDDDDVRELLENTLSSYKPLKLKIDSFPGAEDAFASCVLTHYDLVVTDFKLPGMDGQDFIKKFRSEDGNSDTPILFLSGFFQDLDSSAETSVYENVIFLEKPFDPIKFQKKVEFLLKKSAILASGDTND